MKVEDTPQANEIDREAFPTQWPAPSYRHELSNKMAHFLVAYEDEGNKQTSVASQAIDNISSQTQRLTHRIKHLFSHDRFFGNKTPSSTQHIVGMTGFWLMGGEAHITTIAVRESYRHRGIGELLLISAVDQALHLHAQVITLEVRLSNRPARSLYLKYGFQEIGIRPGYYRDNGEDAVIMTTPSLPSTPFQDQFQRKKLEYAAKLA